jgi:hypothetical protein
MVKDTEKVVRKLKSRVAVAGGDFEEGLRNPSAHPIKRALEKLDKLYQALREAIESGKIEAGLREALEKGRWEEAIDIAVRRWIESKDRMAERYAEAYDEKLKPCLEECEKKVANMPDLTLEQRIQKSAEFQRCMSECTARRKGLKMGGRR